MIPQQNYQQNFSSGMNETIENDMLRQDPFINPEMFPAQIPAFYPNMTQASTKTPAKFIKQIEGMFKTIPYEESYGYMEDPQIIMSIPPTDCNIQYGISQNFRPQQTTFKYTPNPKANAYVPQEPFKSFAKQNQIKSQNQVKIKNIPEFVPRSNINSSKDGDLIQIQVHHNTFNTEKEKQQFGVQGLVKQSEEERELLQSLDLRNMDKKSKGLISSNLITPQTQQQSSISELPNLMLPSCYAQLKPSLRNSHFQKFNEETLLYIFYFFPKDQLQALAAEELQVYDLDIIKNEDLVIKIESGIRTIKYEILYSGNLQDVINFLKFTYPRKKQKSGDLPIVKICDINPIIKLTKSIVLQIIFNVQI